MSLLARLARSGASTRWGCSAAGPAYAEHQRLEYDKRDRPVFNIFKEHRTTVALAEPLVACVWAGFDDPRTIVHGGYADQGGGSSYRR